MPLKGPLSIFWYLATEKMFKNPKRSTLLARQFGPTFGFFGYCRREYVTLWSPCAIIEPYAWRRLMPFPACLTFKYKFIVKNTSDRVLIGIPFYYLMAPGMVDKLCQGNSISEEHGRRVPIACLIWKTFRYTSRYPIYNFLYPKFGPFGCTYILQLNKLQKVRKTFPQNLWDKITSSKFSIVLKQSKFLKFAKVEN